MVDDLEKLLGTIQSKFEQVEELREELYGLTKKAIEKYPDNVEALVVRGNFFYGFGKYKEAVDQYRTALEIDKHHFGARTALIRSLFWSGKQKDARIECVEAIDMYPDEGLFDHFLGQLAEKSPVKLTDTISSKVQAVHHYEDAIKKFVAMEKLNVTGKKYLRTAREAIGRIKEEFPYHSYSRRAARGDHVTGIIV